MQRAERYPWADRTPKTHALLDAARSAGLERRAPAAWPSPSASAPGAPLDSGAANVHGAARETCRLCGECNVGCQYGAKQTSTSRTSARRRRPARRSAAAARRASLERDGERLGRALSPAPAGPRRPSRAPARPGRRARARGRRRSRRPRGGDVRLAPACCCATAPRCRGSARAWDAASRATATCCSSCAAPTATSTPPPDR